MLSLALSQPFLWLILLAPLALLWTGILLSGRKDRTTPLIISGVYTFLTLVIFPMGMIQSSGVQDICILNGHAQYATYEEGYTREYTTTESYTDSEGKTQTRTVTKTEDVPPSWEVTTTFGDESITEGQYIGFVRQFGNQVKTDSGHPDQISHGDGRTFVTRWSGTDATMVPWVKTEDVVNWVKGSEHTLMKESASSTPCLPYPSVITTARGPKFPRVLNEGAPVPAWWSQAMEWNLDVLADKVGKPRQCNPFLYITNKDISQFHNIKAQWIGAKKNDIVVVMGIKEWPKVEWVQVLCWSKKEDFPVKVQNMVQDVHLEDGTTFTNNLHGLIWNDYERRPMVEFEYLKNEIEVPMWLMVLCSVQALLAVTLGLMLREVYTPARYRWERPTHKIVFEPRIWTK